MNAEELRDFSSSRLQSRAGRRQLTKVLCCTGASLAWAALLSCVLLTGCATPPNARPDLLAFLEPGRTTREEVLLKLGQPSASFEQERILTYRLGQYGEEGYFIVSPKVAYAGQSASWQNVHFSLVIVFDEQGRLRKHGLVKVD